MNNLFKKLKRRNKVVLFSYLIIVISYLLSYAFFLKNIVSLNGIETKIRIVILVIFGLYFLIYLLLDLINIINKKYILHILLSFLTFIFIIIFCFSSFFLNYFYDKINAFREKDKTIYTSYLINLKDSTFNSESTIGMINDQNDDEGYILAKKLIIKENLDNKVTEYDDYLVMLNDLYNKKIDAIFVQSNYLSLYDSDFPNINDETKQIKKYQEELANKDKLIISTKDFSEPISILLMGVDSETDGLNANEAFNGDTLMLITFNPDTMNVTMFSMPRDIVVPISCRGGKYARINSSAGSGTSCVIKTVEDLTDIDIDYYAKINFKGVVDLVDALGGVEVNVEKPDFKSNQGIDCKGMVCEQNSDRDFGSKIVYINTGLQTLNGEQSLAYSRNRHQYLEGDIARNRHQQEVVTALVSKVSTLNNYKDFENILDVVSKNISTNMTTNQILSGYQVIKNMLSNSANGEEFINIDKTYLEYYNLNVYFTQDSAIAQTLGYYADSLEAITKLMKINLNIEKAEDIKTFSFSVNEDYEVTPAGKNLKTKKTTTLLESLIGKTKAEAESYCKNNSLKCTYSYVNNGDDYFNNKYQKGYVGNQSLRASSLIQNISSLTIYINDENPIEENTNNDQKKDDNSNEDIISNIPGIN